VSERIEKVTVGVPITKLDDDQRIAYGWASVVQKDGQHLVDVQGDMIEVHELEKAAHMYVQRSREAGDAHTRKTGIGSLVESFVVTPEKLEKMGLGPDALPLGWWVGYKVHDESVWSKVKSGEYAMFSIGGLGKRKAA